MYHTRARNINHLKARPVQEWQKFTRWAIKQWDSRLKSYVGEGGPSAVVRLFVADHT